MNKKVIQRIANGDQTGEIYEEQVRFSLDPGLLISTEAQTPLGSVFDMFRAGVFEDAAEILTNLQKLPPAMHECLTVIDIAADDPTSWRCTQHAVRSQFQNCTGLPLSSLKSRINREAVLVEYMIAKEYVRPLYHEIHQWQDSISRHYARLIVPVKLGSRPHALLICSRILPASVVPLSNALQAPLLATG